MPNWINFSTVEKWALQNSGATDCSAKCRSCQKKWHDIKLEGRGEEAMHMIELKPEEKTPCGMPFAFECNQCYANTQ